MQRPEHAVRDLLCGPCVKERDGGMIGVRAPAGWRVWVQGREQEGAAGTGAVRRTATEYRCRTCRTSRSPLRGVVLGVACAGSPLRDSEPSWRAQARALGGEPKIKESPRGALSPRGIGNRPLLASMVAVGAAHAGPVA